MLLELILKFELLNLVIKSFRLEHDFKKAFCQDIDISTKDTSYLPPYCKFGNFREDIIFAKLRICEVS